MEGAKDPDEFVLKYGSGRFNLLVDEAISLMEFKVKMLKKQFNLENPNDKIKFLKEISKLLAEIDNKIEQEIFIEKIANENGISKEAIYAEVNKLLYNKDTVQKTLKKTIIPKKEVEDEIINESIVKRENMILYLLINNFEEVSKKIKDNITQDDFKIDSNKKIFCKIFEINDGNNLLQNLSNIEDDDIQKAISRIVVPDYELSSESKCVNDIVNNYIKERLNVKKSEIIKLLEDKEISKDEMKKLEEELSKIIIQLAKMK